MTIYLLVPIRNTNEIQNFSPAIEMRPFLLVFTRRFLIPCGALASGTIAGSFSNVNEQKHHSGLKSIGRSFFELLMGSKG